MQTAVMSPVACAIIAQFDLHTRLFNNVLDGISESEANTVLHPGTNNIKWLAGHLTSSRFGLKNLAGLDLKDPHAELFGHGHGFRPDREYPTIDEIRSLWESISDPISAGLSRLPEETLNGPAPTRVPIGDDTFEGMLAFLLHHEAYHIGQIGLLRRQLGKKPMAYK
ncbi:MAG: DinB family protein [Rhodothermales bacterium]|nr:DinB family protein [Rhodothermales bacterium]